jgi:hypothetical protein
MFDRTWRAQYVRNSASHRCPPLIGAVAPPFPCLKKISFRETANDFWRELKPLEKEDAGTDIHLLTRELQLPQRRALECTAGQKRPTPPPAAKGSPIICS